jgi:fructose-specific phosphotransferase system component IIB
MNDAKSILDRIGNMLFSKEEPTVEVELAQVKTADGAAIFDAEAFEIGQAVFIVTEEGNIPVPTGEYMLEEGLKIKVDEQGVIVEVETEGAEEVAEEVEAKDEPMKEETGMMESAPKKVVKSKTEMEESYFSKIETRLSAIEKSNEDLKAVNVQLSAENEELKKQLAETPAPHTKFNPDAESQRDVKFKIGARREETIQDRVFNQLF